MYASSAVPAFASGGTWPLSFASMTAQQLASQLQERYGGRGGVVGILAPRYGQKIIMCVNGSGSEHKKALAKVLASVEGRFPIEVRSNRIAKPRTWPE